MFPATVSQSSNVVIMEESCIYLHYVIKYDFLNPEVCELYLVAQNALGLDTVSNKCLARRYVIYGAMATQSCTN